MLDRLVRSHPTPGGRAVGAGRPGRRRAKVSGPDGGGHGQRRAGDVDEIGATR